MSSRRLLIRPGAIGDCILSLPALEFLATGETEVWVSSPLVPLVAFARPVRPLFQTGLDLVGVGDLEIPAALQTALLSFDSIVSWYGSNRPEFRDALQRIGARCSFHRALPPPEFPGHATDFYAGQVGAPNGLVPCLAITPCSVRPSVVIHPFSGSARKNWPFHLYREFASKLACPVEWTAGPEEELPEATRFSNLAELVSWIAGARLYVGNDSGITHLAAAAGVPTLALFGPSSPATWSPRGQNVCVLQENPLDGLPVAKVLEAANRLLGSR